MKTRVTVRGQDYDIYSPGYDLTQAGKFISFADNTYQIALFAEALVNYNPAEANQLSHCFHRRDQIADIQKQLECGQLIVIQPGDNESKRPGEAGYSWLKAPSDYHQTLSRSNPSFADSRMSAAAALKTHPPVFSKPQYKDSTETKERLNHKLVIEVAGRDLSNKQSIVLNKCKEGTSQRQYSVNDHKYSHRSLVTFNNLTQCNRSFGVAIAMAGEPSPMVLPLNKHALPCKGTIAKKEWDNILIPIKPMRYFSTQSDKNNAGLLRGGWLYVFWQGRLWRELEVKENSALRDVRVEWYRSQYGFGFHKSDEAREAEGHWLTNIWVPYKLDNDYQLKRKGVRVAFSETQWSWGKIKEIESNTDQLLSKTASVDAVEQYSKTQSFELLDGDMSSINTILHTVKSTDQSIVDEERKQKIPVIFLNAAANTLNFLFELDPFDSDDRDDLITLQTADKSWRQTIQVQDARMHKPNWAILEYSGMPKASLLSMIQDPNDGEPAFYLFQNLTYQQVIELTESANTHPEDDYLDDAQANDR
ncbi:toxin VasX [Alkalimarinus coralli]|uniref:toxin VasX n=1 Tax=Alkalimarinus coralli TaxID=2935863 RepID=UPI00202B8E4F|nr:toxin VasX [Alkalimarinus coralli]